jgi:hypothetical protein
MRGRALIIATSRYSDPDLTALPSASIDATELHEVLANPRIGDFDVAECLDLPSPVWRERIVQFFSAASPDEMLLLYISGHGIKDQPGRLYFAATDTRQNLVAANGIPASFIDEAANSGRSRRVVLIFDSCFSGAAVKGWQLKASSSAVPVVDVGHYFREATGRVVITASDRMQYALAADGEPSLFTKHLTEGLRTGAADLDGNGEVSSAELVTYVAERMRSETQAQEPKRWALDLSKGVDLVIASNPRRRRLKLPQEVRELLPEEVAELIENPAVRARLYAVHDLERLLPGQSPVAQAARQALEWLLLDDWREVSGAAAAVFQRLQESALKAMPLR